MESSIGAAVAQHEKKLADYVPPAFLVSKLNLTFVVEPSSVVVKAKGTYKRNSDRSSLVLDGGPYMRLLSMKLDDKELRESDYKLESESLTVFGVPDEFSLEIETVLLPSENTRLEGLYESGGNLCTQCEAEGFRHITYFIDRPDVLAVYDVRIEADRTEYPVLLSNGNLVSSGDLPGGRHFVEWHDPHPKPCYLFALVAGQLEAYREKFTTKSGRMVDLNIYVRQPDLDKCEHAMQSLIRSMRWDEDVYGLEYDLDIYNIVAVSDFNMGAMENKGLNIFNTKYVLASPATATDTDFDNVEGVIGHEYFHNWTGNRVTCRDWFQLSLKEGLTVYRDQEFSADMGSRGVKRIEDVRVLRLLQFPEDAGPLAHPIRPESYIEINNFYTATVYNKGAEVIRMMHRMLGDDNFKRGVNDYLITNDGTAATCEDFIASMQRASNLDLSQFRLWYSQAGTPRFTCHRFQKDDDMVLTIKQDIPDTPGQTNKSPMQIPLTIAWLDDEGQRVQTEASPNFSSANGETILNVTETEQSFVFKSCPKNATPSFLRGFTAPIILNTDLTNSERGLLLRHDDDPYSRWQAGQELYNSYLLHGVDADWQQSEEANSLYHAIAHSVASIVSDRNLDPAFAAELISVPSEVALGQEQETLEPEGLHRVRSHFLTSLADHLYDDLRGRIIELVESASSENQKAQRRLKNSLLGLLACSKDNREDAAKLVCSLYDNAKNMTDQFGALSILCQQAFVQSDEKLQSFYLQWKSEDLVVDKWFAVQAQSPATDANKGVGSLMDHEAFTIKNPNRLRSLISMFAMSNQLNFHAKDGSGYNLLANVVGNVDTINPQTAARMLAPLGRWARLDADRQKLMKGSLETLLQQQKLSNDVREMAEKSLRV